MFRKIIAGFSLAIVALVSNNANAIVVTLDDNSLTVVRPFSGTTVVDFIGQITISPGYQRQFVVASSLWTAGGATSGDMIDSVFPTFPSLSNLSGTLFSVTVSALDGLGLYAFAFDGAPASVIFDECPIGIGGTCNNFTVNYSLDVVEATVPEPASGALLALGLFGLGFFRRKKA